MARSPIIETYKRVEGMVAYVRENLNPGEYDLFLDMVAPEPEPIEAPKQTRKKRTARTPKLTGLPKPGSEAPKADAGALCVAVIPGLNVACNDPEDALIHDPQGGYGGYHPFAPPVVTATKRSRQKKEGALLIPNTVNGTSDVSAVGASAGD